MYEHDHGKFVTVSYKLSKDGEIKTIFGKLDIINEYTYNFINLKDASKTKSINPGQVIILEWMAEEVKQ